MKNWKIRSLRESDYTVCQAEDVVRLRALLSQALIDDEELFQLLSRQLDYLRRKRRRVVAVLISLDTLGRLVSRFEDGTPWMGDDDFQQALNLLSTGGGQVASLARLPVYANDKLEISLHVVAEAKFD